MHLVLVQAYKVLLVDLAAAERAQDARVRVLTAVFLGATKPREPRVVVVTVLGLWLGEETAFDGGLKGTQRRQAGNHHADVRFYSRPVADGEIVPGHVVCVGELNQILQAKHTDDGDAFCVSEREG